MSAIETPLQWSEFERVEMRIGTILEVNDFPEARKPAFQLLIDFGSEIGIKHSSAQLTKYYTKEKLLGKKILGVVNFPPRQIGPFISEVLTLGVPDSSHECVLITPDLDEAEVGGKLF